MHSFVLVIYNSLLLKNHSKLDDATLLNLNRKSNSIKKNPWLAFHEFKQSRINGIAYKIWKVITIRLMCKRQKKRGNGPKCVSIEQSTITGSSSGSVSSSKTSVGPIPSPNHYLSNFTLFYHYYYKKKLKIFRSCGPLCKFPRRMIPRYLLNQVSRFVYFRMWNNVIIYSFICDSWR